MSKITEEIDEKKDLSSVKHRQIRRLKSEPINGVIESKEPVNELKSQKSFREQADELEKSLKEEGACGKNCHWITAATLAGVCLGSASFIYASNFAELGVMATGLLGPGAFAVFLPVKVIREAKHRYDT